MIREEPSGPFLELSIPRAIQGFNRERGDPQVAWERETFGNGSRCPERYQRLDVTIYEGKALEQ